MVFRKGNLGLYGADVGGLLRGQVLLHERKGRSSISARMKESKLPVGFY